MNDDNELTTFALAKVFIVKFCQLANLTIGMADINKAVDDIQTILDDLILKYAKG